MNKRKLLIILVTISVLFTSGFLINKSDIYFEIAKNIDIFTKVYKEVSFNYVDEINPEQFLRAGIRGMLSSLDPYTVFIDEKRQDDIELLTNGKYGGIGVTIGVRDAKVTIIEIMDGYSAQRQGIRIGDAIIQVDSVKISPENFEDISSYVKGEPGTMVLLKLLRNNEKDTLVFNVLREEVTIKNVAFAGFVPEESNNVYLKLTGFSRTAGEELKKSILDLNKQKEIKSVVLDLRGNPGGLLDAAVDVSGKFLERGQLIVSTKGRDSSSLKQYFSSQEPLLKDVPLIVLVNEGSASASEIVAGAIQDHDRGIIIGVPTFGKGLVQTIAPLSYNTSLKITTSKYYTPSGRCIQKVDYSKKNPVIPRYDTLITSTFNTDNKRIVYGSGGIKPDSIINDKTVTGMARDLLAKGLIFKFATKYYEKNADINYQSLKNEILFNDFSQFLKDEKYEYRSEISVKIDELVSAIEKNNNLAKVKPDLNKLKEDIILLTKNQIELEKDEILLQIRIELASRIFGREGIVKEILRDDIQFKGAINLISNISNYNKMLNK